MLFRSGPEGDSRADSAPADSGAADSGPTDSEPSVLAGTTVLPEDTTRTAPLTAAATLVRFGDGPQIGGTLTSAPVGEDGTFTLTLPGAAPEGDVTTLDAHADPVVTGALYAVVVFEDSDGDGGWTEGETLRGLAMDTWLSWTDAWQLVDLGFSGQYAANRCLLDSTVPLAWREGYPRFSPLDAGVSVPLRGLPATLVLGGTMSGTGYAGMAGVPYAAVAGEDLPVAFDVPFASTFSVSLTDAPPDDTDYGSDPDWRWTVHLPVVYVTDDWTAWDGATACAAGLPVYARYTRAVTTYRGYRFLDCYQGNVGWRMARSDADLGTV